MVGAQCNIGEPGMDEGVYIQGNGGLTHLQRAIPSFNASSRSPVFSGSPKVLSIHLLTSFARCGVYLSRRIERKSLSREDTEAILVEDRLEPDV